MKTEWTNDDEIQRSLEMMTESLEYVTDYYNNKNYSLAARCVAMNLIRDAKLLYNALEGLQKGEKMWKEPESL